MDNNVTLIIIGVIGLIVGFVISKLLEKNRATKLINSAKKIAAAITKEAEKDAEALKKNKII